MGRVLTVHVTAPDGEVLETVFVMPEFLTPVEGARRIVEVIERNLPTTDDPESEDLE
jgi:hypothetical protein